MRLFPRLGAALTMLAVCSALAAQPAQAAQPPYCDPYGDPSVYQACIALRQSEQQAASNQAQLAQVESERANTEQAIIDLENFIAHLNGQIAAEEQAIARTKARIAELNRQIAALEADIARREAHIAEREKLLDRRIRAMDMHGSIDYLQLIVTASSFTDLLDRILTMQEIIRADHSLIVELRAEKAKVKAERDQVAARRDAAAGLLGQQQAEEAQLAATRAQQQEALALERQREAQLRHLQAQLAAAQQSLNNQVAQDQAAYSQAAAAAGGGSGQFSWPERGDFYISQGFGCTDYPLEPPPPDGVSCPSPHYHYGIDIAGPYGANVYAADTGYASTGYDEYGYGNYIVLTHGNGYSTLYGHLSGFNVSDGQLVSRGQVIGFEGSTGNSSGPHLHFGVEYNGSWVNPCAYLVPSC